MSSSPPEANPAPDQERSPADPRARPDNVRRLIAILLIALLWGVVGGMFLLLGAGVIHVDELKEFHVIVSPIAVLVSAATGFYYGARRD
jgi:hypothetical protein